MSADIDMWARLERLAKSCHVNINRGDVWVLEICQRDGAGRVMCSDAVLLDAVSRGVERAEQGRWTDWPGSGAGGAVRVLCVGGDPLAMGRLAAEVTASARGVEHAGTVAPSGALVAEARRCRADVVIMDVAGVRCLEAMRELSGAGSCRVIALTAGDAAAVEGALEAGALETLTRDAGGDEVVSTVRRVMRWS